MLEDKVKLLKHAYEKELIGEKLHDFQRQMYDRNIALFEEECGK